MKLYDNDSYRDTFTEAVYSLLSDDPMWDRANQIIDLYDSATAVEVPDSTLGGTYVNVEWLRRTEEELKKYNRDRLRTVQAQGRGAVALLVYEVPGLY